MLTDATLQATIADVTVFGRGRVSAGDAGYARSAVNAAVRRTHLPVGSATVKLARADGPYVAYPVLAEADVEVAGVPVRAQVAGPDPTAAADALADRLSAKFAILTGDADPYLPPPAGVYAGVWAGVPRSPRRPRIVRHKSYRPAWLTVDEAVRRMELMDYRFHLFTELESGQHSMLYRLGARRYRLAQLRPDPRRRWDAAVPLTVNRHPAPRLTLPQAAARLGATGDPALFFAGFTGGRGRVLYRRYDGHYGLIVATDADAVPADLD